MSAWHDRVVDLTLFEALTGGAFDRENGNIAGNLTKIFQKSQMPWGLPGGDGRFWNWPVHYIRLRVVPLSLNPSCVMLSPPCVTQKNGRARSWGREARERRDYPLSPRVWIMRCSHNAKIWLANAGALTIRCQRAVNNYDGWRFTGLLISISEIDSLKPDFRVLLAPGFYAAIFFAVFFRVMHDGLSERGTSRSLRLIQISSNYYLRLQYTFRGVLRTSDVARPFKLLPHIFEKGSQKVWSDRTKIALEKKCLEIKNSRTSFYFFIC